jgi:hypothetical protein
VNSDDDDGYVYIIVWIFLVTIISLIVLIVWAYGKTGSAWVMGAVLVVRIMAWAWQEFIKK